MYTTEVYIYEAIHVDYISFISISLKPTEDFKILDSLISAQCHTEPMNIKQGSFLNPQI